MPCAMPQASGAWRGRGTDVSFKEWTQQHEGVWQSILFNVLSNISTITRFACTWVGTAVLIGAMGLTTPFSFLIFNYPGAASGGTGLGGFITFLIAEVAAQVVNFFMQMKLVFRSTADFSQAAPKFAVLAVVIVVVNLILPGHITALCQNSFGMEAGLSGTIASVANTLLAVVVSFPALKFWITVPSNDGKAATS